MKICRIIGFLSLGFLVLFELGGYIYEKYYKSK